MICSGIPEINFHLMAAGLLAATTGVWCAVNHLFDLLIHGLLQVADDAGKLAGDQTFVAGGAGGIGFFEPIEGFVDRCVTVRASEVYFRI